MAFPAVQGTPAESSTNTAGTSHVVTLPESIQAGELLLVFIDKGSTAATFNALTGWTELLDENLANGIAILYRLASGSEGASITLTSSASTRTASIAYRVGGAMNPGTTPPTLGTVGTGTSTGPDPGNCNPGSAKDYLWFTMFGGAGEEADDDTWCNSAPADFTGLLQKACGTIGTNLGGKIAVAYRQFNASSLDAGAFNQDVSTAWRAYTVAIHPAPTISGTLAATETQDDATVAGGVYWAGTLAATEAVDAATLAGKVVVSGALATTEPGDDATCAGTVAVVGALAATEAADDATMAGAVSWPVIQGILAAEDLGDAVSLAGSVTWEPIEGILAAGEGQDSASLAGTVSWPAIGGALGYVEAPDVVALPGGVLVAGQLVASEALDVPAAVGGVLVEGALSVTEGADVFAWAGATGSSISGFFVATDGPDVAALAGAVVVAGPLVATEGPDVASFAGPPRRPPEARLHREISMRHLAALWGG